MTTFNLKTISALFFSLTVSCKVIANNESVDACLSDIQNHNPSEVVKVEKLNKLGKSVYAIEVRDNVGFEWEYSCNAIGKIIAKQSEVSGTLVDAFRKHMKLSESTALAIAMQLHPGKLTEVEYVINANGSACYEFDILDALHVENKIEINAATGKVMDVAVQEWQIGAESEEQK